jgi:hypothetical protein
MGNVAKKGLKKKKKKNVKGLVTCQFPKKK